MRILAVNDDGIACAGIQDLTAALISAGHELVVVAPDREQSGMSHALSLGRGIAVKELEPGRWACRGTPADCVIAALSGGFIPRPELVVSGINAGANLGTDLIYSGTAAGARQAALDGLPGIAFSLDGQPPFDFHAAAAWAAAYIHEFIPLIKGDMFLNVNFPSGVKAETSWRHAVPARRRYTNRMTMTPGGNGWQLLSFNDFEMDTAADDGSDCVIVEHGFVALSRVLIQPAIEEIFHE
ncbi:MAG: 5'/3'-nucleotidase SurE [Spirochaetaceae bacterium]|jgi:5'-nucleotidase|nr:5'/3'-nucleotidase SurE [Spirochaetaceae bacterium]